jgi:NADH:ubiquinone oxidoreductase subunit
MRAGAIWPSSIGPTGLQYQPLSGQSGLPVASERHDISNRPSPHEAVSAEIFHLVERPDIRHAIVDVAIRRAGRPGRAGRKIDPTLGFERRWVIYNGYAEASRVPPSWHGWLHHTVDVAPTEENYTPREWEKPHVPNMTGTPAAYRPSGSTLASGRRPKATGDYQAWTPGS